MPKKIISTSHNMITKGSAYSTTDKTKATSMTRTTHDGAHFESGGIGGA